MCGIAGYYRMTQVEDDLEEVLNSFKHRGPDKTTSYRDNFIHFGANRLSINDLIFGDQPFETPMTVCFYNGEIYNYIELKHLLKKYGRHLKSNVDGEVIPHLYELFGRNFTKFLDGMYAISIYDKNKKSLILARDLAGEKPLYYSINSKKSVYFASSLSAFTKFRNFKLSLDGQSIWDLPTFLWIPEPNTIYQNVKTLKPGEIIEFTQNRNLNSQDFYTPLDTEDLSNQDIADLVAGKIARSIHTTLMSDVPVGTFLSSGLDSSIVTRISAEKITSLNTFSVAFPNGEDPYVKDNNNEAPMARDFANKIGSIHHEVHVDSEVARKELREFVKFSGEPFAVSSAIGVKVIAREAAKVGVKVILSGDGADELFGGYSWYSLLAEVFQKRRSLRLSAKKENFSMQEYNLRNAADSLANLNDANLAWAFHYYASENDKANLFSKEFSENKLDSKRYFEKLNEKESELQPLDIINNDRDFYLPQEMLRKVDRMTMAHSVEGRVPFVRKEIQELARGLKLDFLVNGEELKQILRKAFHDYLPEDIIKRKKHGFNFPIEKWLNEEWLDLVHETFSPNSYISQLGMINESAIKVALEMITDKKRRNGHTIFSFIVLEIWLQEFMEAGNRC